MGMALLGSPNGIAAGYFLAQHKTEIGTNKYVYQVQIFTSTWGVGPTMILYVKDVPAPPSGNAKPAEKRRRSVSLDDSTRTPAAKPFAPKTPSTLGDIVTIAARPVLDDATLWNTCKCRGEKITQASLQNKDTAINLVTPIESPWEGTMEEELKLWGYKEPKGLSLYCNFDSVAREFGEMGIDTKFKEKTQTGQNECYQAHHSRGGPRGKIKDQTYEVDHKIYHVSEELTLVGSD
ncbi:hypothetical protein N0V86_007672 [Didymella sp. IMI 355093]|nr:hypothetical protein N0V86_007672 [Didymella sp. IMI 355093]